MAGHPTIPYLAALAAELEHYGLRCEIDRSHQPPQLRVVHDGYYVELVKSTAQLEPAALARRIVERLTAPV